jgi:hypothetical protein
VIDITNPQNPLLMGSVEMPTPAWDVAISGSYAYVANHRAGMHVVNIGNPESPQLMSGVNTPHTAFGIAISGNHAYVADSGSGVQVLPLQCEPTSSLEEGERVEAASALRLRALPNPSSWRTVVHLETHERGYVQASVYDSVGRRVRRLSGGYLGAGVHDLTWDGRNQEGHAVASGIYLIRVSTAEGTATERCMIIR